MNVTLGGVGRMIGRNWEVYRATWKMNALPPLAEPLLYLLAMGYGLGALVEDIQGVPYIVFLAPAIVAITSMNTAFMETTYSSYIRMTFQRTWEAVMATPVTISEILWAEVLWAAIRSTINASLMLIVVAAFGLLTWPTALLIPIIAFLAGMMFAGIGLFVCAKVRVIDQFSYAFFLFITPMFLFSGTFFPLRQLPEAVQWLAMALPLTHTVALIRSVGTGVSTGWELWHLAYMLVAAFALPWLAVRAARSRVVS